MIEAWQTSHQSKRSFRRNQTAVSDVIATLLLIGVTVTVISAFALFMFSLDGPAAELQADFSSTVSPGNNGWETGDETISIRHLGGDGLEADSTIILVTVNHEAFVFQAETLAGGFDDGVLIIGETWTATMAIPENAEVNVQIISSNANTQILLYDDVPKVVA